MPGDPKNSMDSNDLLGVFARLGHAWLAAGADLWGRSSELGGRRMADALTGALSDGSQGQRPRRGVDAMLQRYRGLLGEMALLGPLAAQRFARELATPRGNRLLFSAGGREPPTTGDEQAPPSTTDVRAGAAEVTAVCDMPMPSLSELDAMGIAADDPAYYAAKPYGVRLLVTAEVLAAVRDALAVAGVTGASAEGFFGTLKQYLEKGREDALPSVSLPELQEEIRDTLKRLHDRLGAAGGPYRALERALSEQESLDETMSRLHGEITQALSAKSQSAEGFEPVRELVDALNRQLHYVAIQRKATRDLLGALHQDVYQSRDDMARIDGRLGAISDALRRRGPAIDQAPAFIQRLKQSLGGTAAEDLINAAIVDRVAAAWQAPEGLLMPDAMRSQLKSAFAGSGIALSGALSVVCKGRDWTVHDHAADRVFDIARVEEVASGKSTSRARVRLDVFGKEEGRRYERPVTGPKVKPDRPILLPLRVQSASQGVVVYPVRKDRLQQYLDTLPDRPFRAWDIGSRRGAAVILVVDYRETDIGDYKELGIGCLVTPKADPAAVGLYLLALPVTSQLSVDVGCDVWAYPKTLEPGLKISYFEDEATCALYADADAAKKGGKPILALALPRGGSDSSADIPVYTYTRKRGLYHRTVFTRSGEGETVTSGGRGVRLELDSSQDHAVLKWLDAVGITTQSTPILTAWTERMSGEGQAPIALDLFEKTDAARPGANASSQGEVIAQARGVS